MISLPLVYIISKENFLSKALASELVLKGCRVDIISSNSYLKEIPNYIFLIDGVGSDFFSKPQIKNFLNFIEKYSPKTEIILPYVVNNETRSKVYFASRLSKKTANRNLQIVYLGQIYEETWAISAIREGRVISVPSFDIDIYLISLEEAVRVLVRGIFSYGFFKKEVVATYKTSAFAFLNKIKEINPLTRFATDIRIKQIETAPNFEFIKIKRDEELLKVVVTEAVRQGMRIKIRVPSVKVPNLKMPRLKIRLANFRFLGVVVFVGLWILMLPFISLFIASLTLKLGFSDLGKSNFSRARSYFNISEKFSTFSNNAFFFSFSGKSVSNALFDFDRVGLKIIDTLTLGNKIYAEITGAQAYDFTSQANELYLDVDYLYQKASFLYASINTNSIISYFIPQTDLDKLIFYLGNGKELVKQLPKILGEGAQTNYLVLIQDSSELRPTGGKINSFGIISFKDGRLISKTIYSVNQADSQLRGQVDPPLMLQKYLGIKSWNLANSNWDWGFSVSASKAEWFLQNELGQATDGVIGINASSNFNTIISNLDLKNGQVFSND